jgi:hypothetical protein
MEQQFLVTHHYTILQETTKLDQSSTHQLKHVMFLQKYKVKQFSYVHDILAEGVFVAQLSNNVRISVCGLWQIAVS